MHFLPVKREAEMEKSPFSCRKNLQVPSGELEVMGKLVCVRVCVLAHACWEGNKGKNGKFLLASEEDNTSVRQS